jgi:hypothetical protein
MTHFLGVSKRLYNSLHWLVCWLVGPLVGPSVGLYNEFFESAYVVIWLRRNCLALTPGLDYPCFVYTKMVLFLAFSNPTV